jgi:mitogen-activated protein kinase organizer 1
LVHSFNVCNWYQNCFLALLFGSNFLADGKYCLTGGSDRSVRLWNPFRVDPAFVPPPSMTLVSSTNNDEEAYSYYGPASSQGSVAAVNTSPPPEALPIQTYTGGLTHAISALDTVTSSASKSTTTTDLLLAASDKTLVISDLVTNQVRRRLQGHSGRINSVTASDGGEIYLSASCELSN